MSLRPAGLEAQLVADFPLYPCGQAVFITREEAFHGIRVPGDELSKRPGHCLHHHVVVVVSSLDMADTTTKRNPPYLY